MKRRRSVGPTTALRAAAVVILLGYYWGPLWGLFWAALAILAGFTLARCIVWMVER